MAYLDALGSNDNPSPPLWFLAARAGMQLSHSLLGAAMPLPNGHDPHAQQGAGTPNGRDVDPHYEAEDNDSASNDAIGDWICRCTEILKAAEPPAVIDRAFVTDKLLQLVAGTVALEAHEQLRLRLLQDKHVTEPAAKTVSLEVWDAGDDTDPIPPREWLLGNVFCRQFLSVLFGAGGVGKTSLLILLALSLATGLTLTHERVYADFRVLLLSFEDGKDELRRRLRAAMIRYGIKLDRVRGRLFLAAVQRPELKLATMDPDTRAAVRGMLVAQLEQEIERYKPDLLVLEPFVKTHAVAENDNNSMDFVASILVELGIKHNIATGVAHHVRKGGDRPGDADAGRGGSALKDAGRLVYTVVPMAEADAKAFGVEPETARQIFRFDAAKVNLAPLASTKWYRTVGVALDNAAGIYVDGDNVGVAEVWKPPAIMSGLTPEIANKILDEIDAEEGGRFSAHHLAVRPAWLIVQNHLPDCTDERAKKIIKTWLGKGVLVEKPYYDKEQRKSRKGLFVDPDKRPRNAEQVLAETL